MDSPKVEKGEAEDHGEDIADDLLEGLIDGGDFDFTFDSDDPELQLVELQAARKLVDNSMIPAVGKREALSQIDSQVMELRAEIVSERSSLLKDFDGEDILEEMRTIDQLRYQFLSHDKVHAIAGSLEKREIARSPEELALLDSFRISFSEPSGNFLPDTLLGGSPVNLTTRQLVSKDLDELIEEASMPEWYNRIIATKAIQLFIDGTESLNSYLLGTVSWAVLLFVPLMAFGYFLLYFRRMPYYSQHLSFTAVNMAVGLLIAGLIAVLYPFLGDLEFLIAGGVIGFLLYIFFAELRVYQVVWWKALIKSAVLFIYGALAFALATALWLLLALLVR